MSSRTNSICGTNVSFKVKESKDERLRDGVSKLKDSLESDAIYLRRRKSSLPKDWGSRVLA